MFAILQKSKLLGDGKAQVDAIVAFVLGLLLIVAPGPRNFIVNFLPWLAVGVAVILAFFILYGFVAGDLSGDGMPNKLKITFGVLAGVFVLGIVLWISGLGEAILRMFSNEAASNVFANAMMILAVVAAVVVAAVGGKKNGKKKE
jgi:hypothetical protein